MVIGISFSIHNVIYIEIYTNKINILCILILLIVTLYVNFTLKAIIVPFFYWTRAV